MKLSLTLLITLYTTAVAAQTAPDEEMSQELKRQVYFLQDNDFPETSEKHLHRNIKSSKTAYPSKSPHPTMMASTTPSCAPTYMPTAGPSRTPSAAPSPGPTMNPTPSGAPTMYSRASMSSKSSMSYSGSYSNSMKKKSNKSASVRCMKSMKSGKSKKSKGKSKSSKYADADIEDRTAGLEGSSGVIGSFSVSPLVSFVALSGGLIMIM